MGLSRVATWLRDPHLSVSGRATRCCYTCIYARVCMWVGQEMTGGAFAVFTNGSLRFTYFPLWSRWCLQVPTYRHVSVAPACWTTKAPQCGAQWVCDGGFLWLGKEWEWNHHLTTLPPNQEGLVVFSERPVGCRCAGPLTSLPQ